MKRKFFTLLCAFVALAAFQVKASIPDPAKYWIKADVTGLAQDGTPYSVNQVDFTNWFFWNGTAITLNKSANIYADSTANYFTLPTTDNVNYRFQIKNNAGTVASIGTDNKFEIVQYNRPDGTQGFPGGVRTTQTLVNNYIEGYLQPTQGGSSTTLYDTSDDALFVVTDPNGVLSVKKLNEWATVATTVSAAPEVIALQSVESFTLPPFYDPAVYVYSYALDNATPEKFIKYSSGGWSWLDPYDTDPIENKIYHDPRATLGGTFPSDELRFRRYQEIDVVTPAQWLQVFDQSGISPIPSYSVVNQGSNPAFDIFYQQAGGTGKYIKYTQQPRTITLPPISRADLGIPTGLIGNFAWNALSTTLSIIPGNTYVNIQGNNLILNIPLGNTTHPFPHWEVYDADGTYNNNETAALFSSSIISTITGGTSAANAAALVSLVANIVNTATGTGTPSYYVVSDPRAITVDPILGDISYIYEFIPAVATYTEITSSSADPDYVWKDLFAEYWNEPATDPDLGYAYWQDTTKLVRWDGSAWEWLNEPTPGAWGAIVNSSYYSDPRYDFTRDADGVVINEGVFEFHKYQYTPAVEAQYSITYKPGNLKPVYIKYQKVQGRWATEADFANLDCKYLQFNTNAGTVGKLVAGGKSAFAVKQVDYVSSFSDNNNNIVADQNFIDPTYGTQKVGADQYVIPLFILSTPEDDCKVLSVSRANQLDYQSQYASVYANKLDILPYGSYLNNANPAVVTAATGANYATYTSLQKFAIWINPNNTFSIYPAASYYWEYGIGKGSQADKILANSVLKYNNRFIRFVPNATPSTPEDYRYAVQVGEWDGHTTQNADYTNVLVTAPNNIDPMTNYYDLTFTTECRDVVNGIQEGRFYFLSVFPPDIPTTGAPWTTYQKYNDKEYVLSTQVVTGSDTKQLVVLPKEKVREYENGLLYTYAQLQEKTNDTQGSKPTLLDKDGNYWKNAPYDSVNMAAHWEFIKHYGPDGKQNGYTIINMLGDTLQYNLPAAAETATSDDKKNLSGGYLTQNDLLYNYIKTPGATQTRWYDVNSVAENTSTLNVWSTIQLKDPNKFNAPPRYTRDVKDLFYLQLNKPGYEIDFSLISGWSNTGLNGVVNGSDNVPGHNISGNFNPYQQRTVGLTIDKIGDLETRGTLDDWSCHGLLIKLDSIYYVPKYARSYTAEKDNGYTNTNDPDFVDGSVKQDSLTAYLLLDSYYDILEARAVGNGLFLDSYITTDNIDVARFTAKTAENRLEIIPLEKSSRNKQIQEALLNDGKPINYGYDLLLGETYKWFIVKYNDKYLVYDTVNKNPGATQMDKFLGFRWETTIEANATPIRFYQPLVGDKVDANFLLQFYSPQYKYYAEGNPLYGQTTIHIGKNAATKGRPIVYPAGSINSYSEDNIQVLFGQLVNQTDNIYGVYNVAHATRFTYNFYSKTECCPEDFVKPAWMAEQRLLGLPLYNELWDLQNPIANGSIHIGADGNQAVVISGDPLKTNLVHKYAARIVNGEVVGVTGKITTTNKWSKFNAALVGKSTFHKDLEVPLYYVINDKGQYLTVGTQTDMFSSNQNTLVDVTGVKLVWSNTLLTNSGGDAYDRRALQLFAISGCQADEEGPGYGNFVYLPLASYVVDYKTSTDGGKSGTVIATNEGFLWNEELGKAYDGRDVSCHINDISKAFRIGQFSPAGVFDKKNLIVYNANGAAVQGNDPAIEVRWKKNSYDKPGCEYQYVQNLKDGKPDKFYTFNSTIGQWDAAQVSSNTFVAHWAIEYKNAKDTAEATFKPELESVYDVKISKTATGKYQWNVLTGPVYFKIQKIENGTTYVHVWDLTNANKAGDWSITELDLALTCDEHTLPFYDLDLDSDYNLDLNKLAILETPFTDRNLTYIADGDNLTPEPIYGADGKTVIGYRSFINDLNKDFTKAQYLNVYKSNRRYLTGVKDELGGGAHDRAHVIPYYAFGLVKDGIEYFLNVDLTTGKVNWTDIPETQKDVIINQTKTNPDAYKNFKFALPYKLYLEDGKDGATTWKKGDFAEKVSFNGQEFTPFYLQTLDVALNDSPYFVIAGNATSWVKTIQLKDAIRTDGKITSSTNIGWNVYTFNYSDLAYETVTSWILGGQAPTEHEWVPIWDAIADGSKIGSITDYKALGQRNEGFITESTKLPVNYGVLRSIGNGDINVIFEGDTLIGDIAKRVIWYYKLQIPGANKYLTDATGDKTINPINWQGSDYTLAYFDTLVPNKTSYVAQGINADAKFIQTFGFKFVNYAADHNPDNKFYIVSDADYTNPDHPSRDYRYLAEVDDHLVFIKNPQYALQFQFGGKKDGGYVGIPSVSSSIDIYGVKGGVKVNGVTGKVDIYSVDGRLLKTTNVIENGQVIAAPQGVLVVKASGTVKKVIVK
jgi:hypothetical protein